MVAEVQLPESCWRQSVVVPPTSCNLWTSLNLMDSSFTIWPSPLSPPQAHLGNTLIPPALKNPLGILASQGYSKTHLIERSANIWSGLSLDPCHMLLKKISLNRGTSPATVIYEWLSFLVQLPIFSPNTFKHLPEAPT